MTNFIFDYASGSSYTTASTSIAVPFITSSTNTSGIVSVISYDHSRLREINLSDIGGVLKLLAGAGVVQMPDNTKIVMDDLGNYEILDKDAKVTYKANFNRAFNRYVNASELLKEFIEDLGIVGVTQEKVLRTPVHIFINWLIRRAADVDDDPHAAENIPTLKESKKLLPGMQKRCRFCQRFLSKKHEELEMFYCNPVHMAKHASKMGLVF